VNDQPDDALDDEAMTEFVDAHFDPYEPERQGRLWVRSCAAFVESMCKANKDGLERATRTAVDEAIRAACDRAARIFHSDRRPIDEPADGD
jgi:hypothetical protein